MSHSDRSFLYLSIPILLKIMTSHYFIIFRKFKFYFGSDKENKRQELERGDGDEYTATYFQ